MLCEHKMCCYFIFPWSNLIGDHFAISSFFVCSVGQILLLNLHSSWSWCMCVGTLLWYGNLSYMNYWFRCCVFQGENSLYAFYFLQCNCWKEDFSLQAAFQKLLPLKFPGNTHFAIIQIHLDWVFAVVQFVLFAVIFFQGTR